MQTIEQSIEVNVPLETAYNQWTQFEEFPQFMDGVESVTQLDDTHLRWVASVAGKTREWQAEIVEQLPDERVAWRAQDRQGPDGVATFHKLDEGRSRVTVQLEWEPEGLTEELGSAIGADSRRVQADLERFKELIESRGVESGAWRGEVKQDVTS